MKKTSKTINLDKKKSLYEIVEQYISYYIQDKTFKLYGYVNKATNKLQCLTHKRIENTLYDGCMDEYILEAELSFFRINDYRNIDEESSLNLEAKIDSFGFKGNTYFIDINFHVGSIVEGIDFPEIYVEEENEES